MTEVMKFVNYFYRPAVIAISVGICAAAFRGGDIGAGATFFICGLYVVMLCFAMYSDNL